MNYLLSFVSTAGALILTVAILNWKIDPAGLFSAGSFGQRFANQLVSSANGLTTPESIDEREFKSVLASKRSSADCMIIGSSHVLQVGSVRRHRSFPECRNILNLGVSGASIEDHIALAWLALKDNRPATLILEVPPWNFAFGKDVRWKLRYPEHYDAAYAVIVSDQPAIGPAQSQSRWATLISAQYARRSLAAINRDTASHTIIAAPPTDEDTGGQLPVTLPDGSLIYSAEYIDRAKKTPIPLGGSDYKNSAPANELRAIAAFRHLVRWIRAQGVQPMLLLTPYHQNVWRLENASTVLLMKETERIVHEIGNELDVPVVGSYHPESAGCSADEFYDFMHPNARCLARMTSGAPAFKRR